jgi:hypothetical protein
MAGELRGQFLKTIKNQGLASAFARADGVFRRASGEAGVADASMLRANRGAADSHDRSCRSADNGWTRAGVRCARSADGRPVRDDRVDGRRRVELQMVGALKAGALRCRARAARPADHRSGRMYRGRRSADCAFVSLLLDQYADRVGLDVLWYDWLRYSPPQQIARRDRLGDLGGGVRSDRHLSGCRVPHIRRGGKQNSCKKKTITPVSLRVIAHLTRRSAAPRVRPRAQLRVLGAETAAAAPARPRAA